MNKIYIHHFKSPFGELLMGEFEERLCLCDWKYRKMRTQIDRRIAKGLHAEFVDEATDFLNNVEHQLSKYFNKEIQDFSIPLLTIGTDFQKLVWDELLKIPYGSTLSYLELARQLGDEKAVRAVASANGSNAISILIPCHRVIGSKGELTGYAGGLSAKKKLLQLEGAKAINTQLEITF